MIRKNTLALIGILFCLASCSDTWLGESEQEIPLEGDRISVISTNTLLSDDLINREIEDIDIAEFTSIGFDENWTVRLDSNSSNDWQAETVLSESYIYAVSNSGELAKINAISGEKKWDVLVSRKGEDTTGIFGGGLAVGEKLVFVSTGFGDLLALDKENGGMVWKYSSIAPFNSSPYLLDGIVFAVNRENETIAIEENSGDILWKQKGAPEEVATISNLQLISDGKKIIPTYTSGEVFALIPQNGKVVWADDLNGVYKTANIDSISEINASSVIAGELLIATGNENQTVAIDLVSGRRVWQKRIESERTPLVIDKYIFILTEQNELVAMSSVEGDVFWKIDLDDIYPDESDIKWSEMSSYNKYITINSSEEEIIIVSPESGEVVMKEYVGMFSNIAPMVHEDNIYLANKYGKIQAIEIKSLKDN